MEEKSIKDFDRAIEQAMNEYSVAPAFGMWNRISAELGNVEEVAVAPKPSTALPKGLVAGFIAGALVIGTTITGLLVYNGNNLPVVNNTTTVQQPLNNSRNQSNNENAIVPVAVENAAKEKNAVVVADEPATPHVKIMVVTAVNTVSAKPAKQVKTTVANIDTNPMGYNGISNNNDVAVPQMVVGSKAASADTYYFPPVDINIPGEKIDAASTANNDNDDEEEVKNNDSKKVISRSSSSPERIKFKKKRRTHYTYPTIVRRKR